MPSKVDPLIRAFRDEIMEKIVKNKLINLAYKNKGSFMNVSDFCEQFRETYEVTCSNRLITGWMKELGIELQTSVTFVNTKYEEQVKNREDDLEEARRGQQVPNRVEEDDLDIFFDNERS